MVVELPEQFLRWNYFPRREWAKAFLEGRHERDMTKFFLDSTRHNPALCTASRKPDGTIVVNAKIVGASYVLKKARLRPAIEVFRQHLELGDKMFSEAESTAERDQTSRKYQREAMLLLMKFLYLSPEEASVAVDFTKMSTMELAKNKPWSSRHTWSIVQKNKTSCLLFYRPPNLSFELHGYLDIHVKGVYYEFVNVIHDAFHYVPPATRQAERPVYIFNVEEVYDNSPTPNGYGKRIA